MGVNIKHLLAVAALSLSASLPAMAAGEPGKSRVEWDKLSAEQHRALKAGSPQVKQVSTQNTHVYVDGVRKSVVVEGNGALAIFRVEGLSNELRHAGRALVKTRAALTQDAMSSLLAGTGLSPLRALDDAGTLWSVQSKPGLEGVQQLNQLQEGGKVISASPDWQRNLKTK